MDNSTSFYPENERATSAGFTSLPEISSGVRDRPPVESDSVSGTISAPVSTITVSHRRTATMHTPRISPPIATVTDIASKVRERLGKALAPELTENQKRKAKATNGFTTGAKNRFESSVFELNFSTWELGNPPRMLTFVIRGSAFRDIRKRAGSKEVFFQDIAPEMAALVKLVREDFARRFKSAFGIVLDAIFVVEFQLYGNPHFHILLTVPLNADGTEQLSNHPKGGRGNLSRFNSYNFKAWAELTLADLSGQRPDLSRATGQGRVTHLLDAKYVKKADSIGDYVARFVNYARKSGEVYAAKAFQHSVPAPYRGQLFNWWGIIGFTNKRHSAAAPEVLVCRTTAADLGARRFFAGLSVRDENQVEMNGTKVDNSTWTVQLYRHCLTGGTFERPLTIEELRQLRRIIMAGNQIADEVVEEPVVERPLSRWQMSYGVRKMSAPFWERPDFNVEDFLAAHDDSAAYEPPMPAEPEPLRPITELLANLGFSPAEQAEAAQTAVRKSGKTIHDAKQFIFTDAD